MKVFYIHINEGDDTGMDAISLVDFPAVQKNFLCFNKDEAKPLQFADESKHIITGVVILADTPIYRYSPVIGEYYVVFSADTIEKMIEKYARNGLFNSVNLDHNDDKFIQSAFMTESYIVNKEKGICPSAFADVPDGSWICSFHIEDENLWKEITTTQNYNGFSIQGIFDLVEEEKLSEQKHPLDELIDEFLK